LGFSCLAKVFEKSKNGQKKCPIPENPGILPNSIFPKVILDQNAHNSEIFIQKVL
jgi:hypothetical protein